MKILFWIICLTWAFNALCEDYYERATGTGRYEE